MLWHANTDRSSPPLPIEILWRSGDMEWAVSWLSRLSGIASSHKQNLQKLTSASTWFLAQESCLLVWLWGASSRPYLQIYIQTCENRWLRRPRKHKHTMLQFWHILAFGCVWSVPGAWASIEARPSSHPKKTRREWPLHRCIAVWNLPVLREVVYTKPLPQLQDREGTPCSSFGCESWEGHDTCIKDHKS